MKEEEEKNTGWRKPAGKLKAWSKRLKRELKALQVAMKEDMVPWYVKTLIIITVAYALSPIDLIPDFIPILGLVDDIIIVPLLIYITVKLIPPDVMEHCRQLADDLQPNEKKNWFVGGLIIALWLAAAAWIVWWFTR